MNFVLFYHSLVSDWNHGNAHFLRGVATELLSRGHEVRVFEPQDAWSARNLLAAAGPAALDAFQRAYPHLSSWRFEPDRIDLDEALADADLVIVHEWSDHPLVERIGRHRASSGRYVLLFHDTHHRSVTDPAAIGAYDLQHFDGVLAFGEVIRERYVARGWARRAYTWHEAADVRVFRPITDPGDRILHLPAGDERFPSPRAGDVVWIGNWGDDERSEEIREYFIRPVTREKLRARVHGVRYPMAAERELVDSGIDYAGWVPNYEVPRIFAEFRATVHIPRRPYVAALPGVPTIRVFEALACGIPLVSCWWDDVEGLFRAGRDFLMVRTSDEMRRALREIVNDPARAAALAAEGRGTILRRHTCEHRVDDLLDLVRGIRSESAEGALSV